MRKFIVISLLSMSLVACSEQQHVTSLVVHKYDVKYLAEFNTEPNRCFVNFYINAGKKSDTDKSIVTNFPCNKIKYFKENSDVETNNDKDDNL